MGGARAPEDMCIEHLSAECVSHLTDPVRACGDLSPWGSLTATVVAYVLAVAGCVALRRDPWPAAQISSLRLLQAPRQVAFFSTFRVRRCALPLRCKTRPSSQSSLSASVLLSSA